MDNTLPTPDQFERVAQLLGREPRGLRGIPVVDADGGPRVIRVASLVEDKPFPTLFWLVDPALNYRIDQLEAAGGIASLQTRVDSDQGLQSSMAADHRAHIELRASLMSAAERRRVDTLGYGESLQKRGIGGIENPSRIRCLHTWYAAHLVVPNTIGRLVDELMAVAEDSPGVD